MHVHLSTGHCGLKAQKQQQQQQQKTEKNPGQAECAGDAWVKPCEQEMYMSNCAYRWFMDEIVCTGDSWVRSASVSSLVLQIHTFVG